MPVELKALKGVDPQLVGYGALLLFAVAGIIGMNVHLGTVRTAVAELQEELAEKEREAENIVLPTADERSEWTTNQNLMTSMLLADPDIPAFFNDLTRLATLNRLERFNLGTEERVLDDAERELSVSETLAQSVGIHRYLVVNLEFSADYRDAVEFVQDVGRLPRLTEFVSVQLRRQPPSVGVTMSFHVYKSEVIG